LSATQRLTRVQIGGAATLGLVCAGLLAHALWLDPAVPYLSGGLGAPWITLPLPTHTDAIGLDPDRVPEYGFARRFRVSRPGPAALELRALSTWRVELDERPLATSGPDPASWKRTASVPLGELRAGSHRVVVHVANPRGPPALQARLRLPDGAAIETDVRWTATVPGAPGGVPAEPARDSRLHAGSLALPTPLSLLAREAVVLAGAWAVAAALAALALRRLPDAVRERQGDWALGAATLYWVVLFAGPFARLPVLMGFDIPAHLLYIDHLVEERALPLASEGWSSYHPPLYHALTAAWVTLWGVGREGVAAALAHRTVGSLAGLSLAWSAWLLARSLWPRAPGRIALAVGIAALLPMNVYMAAYVSNEALHGALVGAAVAATAAVLRDGPRAWTSLCGLGVALGAAALTKYTALLVVPVLAFFVGLAAWLAPGVGRLRAAGRALVPVAFVALLAGWFYARSWWLFGDPLVWNLDVPGAPTWWMQPGFHTSDYYLRFGEVLRHPFFAGFYSFWDGVYSTFWGDGLVAGMVRLETRHPVWSYHAMTIGYLWALPATGLAAMGMLTTLRRAFAADDAPWRRLVHTMLPTVIFVLGFALLQATLRLPFYAQSKAFYALGAAVPLALVGADGLQAPLRWLAAERWWGLRALYIGYLGSLAGVLAAAFLGGG